MIVLRERATSAALVSHPGTQPVVRTPDYFRYSFMMASFTLRRGRAGFTSVGLTSVVTRPIIGRVNRFRLTLAWRTLRRLFLPATRAALGAPRNLRLTPWRLLLE